MSNLRIKLKYKSFEIELEGEEKTVQSEFDSIKQNGLGNIVMGVDLSDRAYLVHDNENTPKEISAPELTDVRMETLPDIKNIVLKSLPSTETEWILVYGYYASNQGQESFNKDQVSSFYEKTNRKSSNRGKNLSRNIRSLITHDYMEALNDSDFIITKKGNDKALEIINREKSAQKKQPNSKISSRKAGQIGGTKKTLKTKSSSVTYSQVPGLNLYPKDKLSLNEFFSKYSTKSNSDYITVVVYYLERILEIENIGFDHIYSCYKQLKLPVPNIAQCIRDMKRTKACIDNSNKKDLKITIQGENYIEYEIPKTQDGK